MAVERCNGCGKWVDLDTNGDDIEYVDTEAFCYDCLEDMNLLCPECGEFKPDDARVKAGMKCGGCAYSG